MHRPAAPSTCRGKTECFDLRHLNVFSEDLPSLLLHHNKFCNKQDVTKGKDLKTRQLPVLQRSKFGNALNYT